MGIYGKQIKNNKGFSLLELVVSLAIFGILIAILSNLIIINMRVLLRNRTRTKVREETGIAMRIFKRDIRNAESVDPNQCFSTVCQITVVEQDTICDITWQLIGTTLTRSADPVGGGECLISNFQTPVNLEVSNLVFDTYVFDVDEDQKMASVKVTLRATMDGLSKNPNTPIYISKTTIASTRNFDPDKL